MSFNAGTVGDNSPICVDLDGTLIESDMLQEAIIMLLRKNLCFLFLLPLWLFKGKAHFKAEIAKRVIPDVTRLPYNLPLVSWLFDQRQQGRKIILATASHQLYAHAVARHLRLFDGVEATHDSVNLSGSNKADRLAQRFGEQSFDYIGNSKTDVAVWRRSKRALVVGNELGRRFFNGPYDLIQWVSNKPEKSPLRIWLKAIRVHQWLKNSLLFVPAILGFRIMNIEVIVPLIVAFVSFSLCASSVYLLNDLIDIEHDRAHPVKRNRPIASGKIPVFDAGVATTVLFAASLALALNLPLRFTLVLLGYYAVTLLYSLLLKRKLLIDVLTLAGLFTVRVFAGSAAIEGIVSTWLLAFCVFFFLSLALVKRFVELQRIQSETGLTTTGRGYHPEDLETLGQAGMASGFASVVVLALFIDSPTVGVNYSNPHMLWLVCPLVLYLIMRIWVLARRNQIDDDPVVFLMSDWRSLLMIGVGAAIMMISQVL